MPLRPEYALINSEFNAFLHAVIGEQDNGVPVTVLSALTRAELDPWAESARLRTMPAEAAADALARTILRLPALGLDAALVTQMAVKLISLLHRRAGSR